MLRSLDDLRTLLGTPTYRGIVGERADEVRVSAHWACGCSAFGVTFERLLLMTCAPHRAGRNVPVPAGHA